MDIPTQEQLIASIEEFLARHSMAESRFGRETVNNPAFVRGLRGGSPPKLDTLIKVQSYMARKDRELATNPPPLELTSPVGEEEVPLPFGTAPATTAGASSRTSSSTNEAPPTSRASATIPSCSDREPDALVAGPSSPTEAR